MFYLQLTPPPLITPTLSLPRHLVRGEGKWIPLSNLIIERQFLACTDQIDHKPLVIF